MPETSQRFKVVGALNYKYDPGCIIPLKDGKIIAFGGYQTSGKPEVVHQALDGKTYGYATPKMVELFDPLSGVTQVLTELPFDFASPQDPKTRQMSALELEDGRILLVGGFSLPGMNVFGLIYDQKNRLLTKFQQRPNSKPEGWQISIF